MIPSERAPDRVAAPRRSRVGVAVGLLALALLVCGCGAPVGALAYWNLWSPARAEAARLAPLAPLAEALTAGSTPDPATVERLAADRTTRADVLDLLAAHGALGLAAERWRTEEARAEADLVRWLQHPNELAAAPDEIELAARCTVGEDRWYAWRYRTHPPHWAAADGWMAGVSGPWPAPEGPQGTWSELAPYTESDVRRMIAERHAAVRGRAAPEVRLEPVAP